MNHLKYNENGELIKKVERVRYCGNCIYQDYSRHISSSDLVGCGLDGTIMFVTNVCQYHEYGCDEKCQTTQKEY